MADVHSVKIRSYNMSQIHGKDTKPEVKVRKYLFSQGFRYRKNDKKLIGKPDIVLPKYKTIVFINGCFWHKHVGCKYYSLPKTNTEFWESKINKNVDRDLIVRSTLESAGWKVITVWECELKSNRFNETMQSLIEQIKANEVR